MTINSSEERQYSAWLRYYFHLDPDKLTDEEFWMRWYELKFCLEQTGQLKY